ncbi:MAG: chloride channel protein [Bacteroidales bacterium]|jgi:CIC family chloride channel protein|nr:chloride channel protein [Bacteroidales bacterium]MCK9449695.1 chloride channel protein [Bacteroidales bacterium]MDD3702507.1 chloride channel protein [Bacteroidales bacterium]MDY0369576.1 chloride channel protein [Bacteroidales bacterium]
MWWFKKIFEQLMTWRVRYISDRQYIYVLSVIVGIAAGISAVVIKKSAHYIQLLLIRSSAHQYENYLYFLYPSVGILLAVLFMRYIIRKEPGHGIPGVLYAISRKKGLIRFHNTFSAIISSALTVGFGGSVGLEGPTVSTGAAIGSNIGQFLRLNHRQIILMIGLASAAAVASIFQAPIAAIVFALEVIMIELTAASLIPLLIATVTAVLTSYFMLGQAVMYPVTMPSSFDPSNTIFYIGLGVLAGLLSTYFTKIFIAVESYFETRYTNWLHRFLISGLLLGLLIFFFPALYGEGYDAINLSLRGDFSSLYNHSIFFSLQDNIWVIFLLFVAVLLTKAFATSFTFTAGGVGGVFAPALFLGAFLGLFYVTAINETGIAELPVSKFAVVGMAGMVAGIMHAPLTGIFLIAEITGGYSLFIPLMIVSTISFVTVKVFTPNSIYTHQLANRRELVTHNKDQSVLDMMEVRALVEDNFYKVHPRQTLGDLVKIISQSKRNIFPVVNEDDMFKGHILLDDIRTIMFDRELYPTTLEKIMVFPEHIIHPDDPMDKVAEKFQASDKYNIVVLQNGKYMGYISRANVFATYRKKLSELSLD